MNRSVRVLLAGAVLLWCARVALAADGLLPLDTGKAAGRDATFTATADSAVAGLKIVAKAKADGWAGVELPAIGGKWDLSKYRFVVAQVRNPGSTPVRITLRLENPNATDAAGWVADGIEIDPRWGWTWTKVPVRRPAGQVKLDLFGLAEYPWGRPYPTGKGAFKRVDHWYWGFNYPCYWAMENPFGTGYEQEPPGIDPANVVKLCVLVPARGQDCTFEIRSIQPAGTAPSAEMLADPAKFLPCIDEFGQYVHADWPGKIKDAADLKKQLDAEAKDLAANPAPAEWDQFGGWKNGPSLKATGFFRVEKHEGKWWLVDPEGKLFFSQGVTCVTPTVEAYWMPFAPDVSESDQTSVSAGRETWFRGLAGVQEQCKESCGQYFMGGPSKPLGDPEQTVDFGWANALRKYTPDAGESKSLRGGYQGPADWKGAYTAASIRRLKSWGINTIGLYSSQAVMGQKKAPYVVCLRTHHIALTLPMAGTKTVMWWGQPSPIYGLHYDPWQPDFASGMAWMINDKLRPFANDPWCIGFVVDSEGRGCAPLETGNDDIALGLGTLTCAPDSPGKKVFCEDLKAKYGDIAKLNAAWGTNYETWDAWLARRDVQPDVTKAKADLEAFHLKVLDAYFKVCRDGIKAIAPNQLYLGFLSRNATASSVKAAASHCDALSYRLFWPSPAGLKLPDGVDKPILIAEFRLGALDRGMLAGTLPDQQTRSAAYKQFVLDALRHPQVIGCHMQKFRDFPATGRGDEVNCNAGLVDIADTPYAEMVQAAREIGKTMYKTRAEAK